MSTALPSELRRLYLDLIQASLTGELYQDPASARWSEPTYDAGRRQIGLDWPTTALTMIGSRRLQNLRWLVEDVLAAGVPGDLIETGVWRGGACIMMRAVLRACGDDRRKVWVADSFAGLPAPEPEGPAADQGSRLHEYPELAVGLGEVQANFERYGLLDAQVVFLPGWFKDTLAHAPIERLAVLRLDGDLYSSTFDALTALYPKVSPGGAVIVDDYHAFASCREAVHDYLALHGLEVRIEEIDGTGVYWRTAPAKAEGVVAAPELNRPAHRYDYEVNPSSSSAGAHILRMVGEDKRVLELGAGPGSITRHLSAAGCRVVATDRDQSALELLARRCERVVELDLEAPDWQLLVAGYGPYDVIILADVLEHLLEPRAVLERLPPLLADGGRVLVSLPHVSHAALIGSLMQEDFAYGPTGLLDRTHLRFFGMKNIDELFRSTGYKVTRAELVHAAPQHTEFAASWQKLDPEQRALLAAGPFADVYQVVLEAVPGRLWPGASLDLQRLGRRAPMPVTGGDLPADGLRLIAFHLPQFHPFAENDQWWGAGFTEWTNVTKAQPLFRGHDQPHLPTELGFYDLRLPATMRAQAELAEAHGISAFCYHYYWFGGRRLMLEPLLNLLRDPEHRLPFCLSWANENWTRRWDGADHELLIEQDYQPGWEQRFLDDLLPFLEDPRYLRLEGLPLLLVYRPQKIPEVATVFELWRQRCRDAGLGGLHICVALTHENRDCALLGADSGVEFPPHHAVLGNFAEEIDFTSPFSGVVHDLADLATFYSERRYPGRRVFRTVSPAWDNTARVGQRACAFLNGTPENYEQWLVRALKLTAEEQPGPEKLVFINGWNEWAEGCHLEPDRRYGRAYLEATLRARQGLGEVADFPHRGPPARERPPNPEPPAPPGPLAPEVRSRRLGGGSREAVRTWVRSRPWLHERLRRLRSLLR